MTKTDDIFLSLDALAAAITKLDDRPKIEVLTKDLEVKGVLNHLETIGYQVVLADREGDPEINSNLRPMHNYLITDHGWADYLVDRLNEKRNGLPKNFEYAYVGRNRIKPGA